MRVWPDDVHGVGDPSSERATVDAMSWRYDRGDTIEVAAPVNGVFVYLYGVYLHYDETYRAPVVIEPGIGPTLIVRCTYVRRRALPADEYRGCCVNCYCGKASHVRGRCLYAYTRYSPIGGTS